MTVTYTTTKSVRQHETGENGEGCAGESPDWTWRHKMKNMY